MNRHREGERAGPSLEEGEGEGRPAAVEAERRERLERGRAYGEASEREKLRGKVCGSREGAVAAERWLWQRRGGGQCVRARGASHEVERQHGGLADAGRRGVPRGEDALGARDDGQVHLVEGGRLVARVAQRARVVPCACASTQARVSGCNLAARRVSAPRAEQDDLRLGGRDPARFQPVDPRVERRV